jgi:pimeloyl-ACP methyl ester carboxylesterase
VTLSRSIAAPRLRRILWRDGPKELSVREQCKGGPVRDPAIEMPAGALRRARRAVLLIHGFNVDMCAAGRAYETFADGLLFRWRARAVQVYWPGDAAPKARTALARHVTPAVSAASYPFQPLRAQRAAEVLADHIADAVGGRTSPNLLRLSIVAHSLGCRVALELLNRLRTLVAARQLTIELVVLMAAAVPLYDVGANGTYNLSRSKAKKTMIYYSGRDYILKLIFPAGQSSYATDPTSLVAGRDVLGLVGPAGVPLANVEKIEVGHGHGRYWRNRDISLRVMQELDGDRRVMSRRVLFARDIDPAPGVEGRTIEGRQIRGLAADYGCGCS